MTTVSKPGQFVTDGTRLGMTIDFPRTKHQVIPVMWSGDPYPVLEPVEGLHLAYGVWEQI